MAQRTIDSNWSNVRNVRNELDALLRSQGWDIIVRIDIEEIPARLVVDVWDGITLLRTFDCQADTRWQRVTEWVLLALDEVVTELRKEAEALHAAIDDLDKEDSNGNGN